MIRRIGRLIGGLLLAAVVVPSAVAATAAPSLVWLELHFAGASGKTRTIELSIQVSRAEDIHNACSTQPAMQHLADQLLPRHPELTGMKFTSGNCATDKSGRIKTGQLQSPQGAAAPAIVTPAIVVMKYRAPDGVVLKAVYGDRKTPLSDMSACPELLKRDLPTFLADNKASYRGDKFLGAACVLAPADIATILNSRN